MTDHKDHIVETDIGCIKPYEKNPRNNEKSIEKVANSIKEFGFLQPIVCDSDGVILAGHTRYAAAKSLGLETVPVLYAGDLTPEQARAYRLADNKAGEGSEWDEELLIGELDLLKSDDMAFEMADFGFDTSAEYRKRKSWKTTEKKCGLVNRIMLRTKCGYMYTSFFNTGKNGKSLEEIKGDASNVRSFADNLSDYLDKVLGESLGKGGWCICTTPRRRHKEGFHFATEVCRTAAGDLGIEDREAPRVERMVGGYTGFLFLDNMGMPLVAMHWEHRFNNMVKRYNEIYRVQMPNITPYVCRHTYCSNQARAGMNPKTLQYLMGHSEIGVTMNVYTHLGLEDAAEEMARMELVRDAREEQKKITGETESGTITQKMFRVV